MLSGFVRVLCLTSKEQGFFLLPFFLEYVILSDHIRTQTHNHLLHKQTLNQTQTHNDLVDKWTLNHLANLAKWLSSVVITYL